VSRLSLIVPILLLMSICSFALLPLVPGTAASAVLGENASAAAVRQVNKELGTDRPIVQQYGTWLSHALRGDLGRSIVNHASVSASLKSRMPVSLELALVALSLAIALGVPLGVAAATRAGTALDTVLTVTAVLGVATPSFFLATVLVLLFSVHLHWLPVTGWVSLHTDPSQHLRHLALPVLALALGPMAIIMRMVRASVREVLNQDYIRTAVAKGLRRRVILTRHVLRNALLPAITLIALQMGAFAGGAIVVETMFGLPGVGRFSLTSMTNHDFPAIQATILMVGAFVMLCNLTADIAYGILNPRITH